MKTHTEHLHLADNTRKKVIIISKTKEQVKTPDQWDIFLFDTTKSHLAYFNAQIRSVLADPRVIAGGDLVPRYALPDSPQSIFIKAGSLDNAGMTKDGLGIEPHLFEAWKSKIEDAINEAISNLKANAK